MQKNGLWSAEALRWRVWVSYQVINRRTGTGIRLLLPGIGLSVPPLLLCISVAHTWTQVVSSFHLQRVLPVSWLISKFQCEVFTTAAQAVYGEAKCITASLLLMAAPTMSQYKWHFFLSMYLPTCPHMWPGSAGSVVSFRIEMVFDHLCLHIFLSTQYLTGRLEWLSVLCISVHMEWTAFKTVQIDK